MNIAGHDIAVCDWSLHPENTTGLIEHLKALGLSHVQLAIGGLMKLNESAQSHEIGLLRDAGITITAGMIGFAGEDYSTVAMIAKTGGLVPDATWPERKAVLLDAASFCNRAGIGLLTTHGGFIPSSGDPRYGRVLERFREIAAELAKRNVKLTLETGQETAPELLQFANDLNQRNVGINFDPANMILYGCGDPIEAVQILGRHIAHVHVKDAILSAQPGTLWGSEVPFGSGQVDAGRFLQALTSVGYRGPLAIEREAGPTRMNDVRQAIQVLQKNSGG